MPAMTIQIITFRLAGIAPADYETLAATLAPQFASLPGLRSKTWLADDASGLYGGVYHWDDRAAMEAYMAGELAAGLRTGPFADLRSVAFDVLEAPTTVTA